MMNIEKFSGAASVMVKLNLISNKKSCPEKKMKKIKFDNFQKQKKNKKNLNHRWSKVEKQDNRLMERQKDYDVDDEQQI